MYFITDSSFGKWPLRLAVLLSALLSFNSCDNNFETSSPGVIEFQKSISEIGLFEFSQQIDPSVENLVNFTNFSGFDISSFQAQIYFFSDETKAEVNLISSIQAESVIQDGDKVSFVLNESFTRTYTSQQVGIEILSLTENDSLSGNYIGEYCLKSDNSVVIGSLSGIIDYGNILKLKTDQPSAVLDSILGFIGANGKFQGEYIEGENKVSLEGDSTLLKIYEQDTILLVSPNNDSLNLNLYKL